jgi:CRISPR system Cascade subunit CasA
MENRFNLVDESWIPVADVGRVSLRQIFTQPEYRSLGGNPVQKIALMKLLLAIAQAAATPEDGREWKALGAEGLARRCVEYLERWHDSFYLYGERPFLQMPTIERLVEIRTKRRLSAAKTASKIAEVSASGMPKSLGAGFYPDMPSDNNTMLSHTLFERVMTDDECALFVVGIMNFSFGGKRVEADMTSLGGVEMGSHYSASAGPSLGGWTGQLHCFPVTGSLLNDLWLNLLTHSDIGRLNRWSHGLGVPPWEQMPATEVDQVATKHKETYQGCLIALSRFVLLKEGGIYYLDGLKYPSVKNGWFEPSLVLNNASKGIGVKYADPGKRPWRELQSLLSFVGSENSDGYECFSLKTGVERSRDNFERFGVWCAGLKVSANSGDQSVKQSDDFVESMVWLHSDMLGESWFAQLKSEMSALDELAKGLYGRVIGFYKEQSVDAKNSGGKLAAQATHLFWQLCERDFQALVDSCDPDEQGRLQRQRLRKRFAANIQQAYDQYCPKETARQLDAWAKWRPNNSKYLKQEG